MSEETTVEETTEEETRVSMIDFIAAWEDSDSVSEVAKKLDMPEPSVNARASKYRSPDFKLAEKRVTGKPAVYKTDENGNKILSRKPIPLKAYTRGGGATLPIDEAFELLAKLRGTSVEAVTATSDKMGVDKLARHAD